MFNLAALGAGFGQGMQQIQQQQESQLRQLQARLALQQIQNAMRNQGLAGQALTAGGIPGFGGGGGLPAMPTQPVGGMPQQAMPSTAPPAPVASPQATGPDVRRQFTDALQDEDAVGAEMTPEQTRRLYGAVGAGQAEAGIPLEPEPAAPAGAPASASGGVPAGDGSASPAASAAPAPPPPTHTDLTNGLAMIQRLDPTAIAQRIAEISPGSPPDAIFGATQELMKMAQGDRSAQYQAAMIGHLLNYDAKISGQNLQAQKAVGTVGGQQTVAAKNAGTAAGNLDVRKQTQERLKAQFAERTRQFDARLQQAKATQSAQDRRNALNQLRIDIEKQLYPGFPAPQPTQEEREALQKQRAEVINELRKSSGMKPLPEAAPAPSPTE